MKYIHVRNLERYQPGYTDRKHIWAKIYIDMVQGDQEAEMLGEIDWSRLIKLIVLETNRQKYTPLDDKFLARRGFDFGVQNMDMTLKNLSHFIELIDVTEDQEFCNETVPKPYPRIEKRREEKNIYSTFEELWSLYPNKTGKIKAFQKFRLSVKTVGDLHLIREALTRYLQHLQVNTWKHAQDGKTWFNSWEDWVGFKEPERRETDAERDRRILKELETK